MSEPVATVEHAHRLGYCNRGMRKWFAGRAITWADFLRHGAPVGWLRAQHDAMATALADAADPPETAP